MNVLLLRFDAPLMSFGDVIVDQHNVTDRFPRLSLLTGLLANALGYGTSAVSPAHAGIDLRWVIGTATSKRFPRECGDRPALGYRHGDAEALEALQARIEFAARWDVAPMALVDYHTVDLGQPKMAGAGWTTRGVPEHRSGGPDAKLGTHIRYRHYWANGVMTVALTLTGADEPSVSTMAAALREPARPLFLGRKTCLPAAPVLRAMVEAPDVLAALRQAPPETHAGRKVEITASACWPVQLGVELPSRVVAVYDQRDWRNQIHTGRRLRREGLLHTQEAG